MRAERFTDVIVGHGEGPVWWPDWGLRITDAYRGQVVGIDDDGHVVSRTAVGSFVGAFRPRTDGGLVAGALRSFVLVDPDGSLHDLGEVWSSADWRMNDGGVDPQGRFLCGSMQTEGSGGAALWRLAADGTTSQVLSGVTISNGLVWSADGRTVYYNDTPTHQVAVFDVADDGSLRDRRVLADLGEDANPDGMTIDAEGRPWVALFGGAQVRCLDPQSGATLEVIEIPDATQTSACTFGGPDLDRLFITTSDEGGKGGPLAGSVFVVEPGVRGTLTTAYEG